MLFSQKSLFLHVELLEKPSGHGKPFLDHRRVHDGFFLAVEVLLTELVNVLLTDAFVSGILVHHIEQ